MFNLIIILTLIILNFTPSAVSAKNNREALPPNNTFERLEILSFKQFQHPTKNFDLSGIAKYQGRIIAINDKNDPEIYELSWDFGLIKPFKKLTTKDRLDLEAIDTCDDDIYISNEKNNAVYKLSPSGKHENVAPDYKKYNLKSGIFDVNKFYEGIALDCKNEIIYLTKEREPRHILTYDLKNKKILKKWNIPEDFAWDFSDAKFENGFLYVLERSGYLVTKINPVTGKVIKRYSYQNFEKGPGYLFGPAFHAQAEALLLTEDEIWVGFDNNGRRATHHAEKEFKLKGSDPLIVRLKRPEGF